MLLAWIDAIDRAPKSIMVLVALTLIFLVSLKCSARLRRAVTLTPLTPLFLIRLIGVGIVYLGVAIVAICDAVTAKYQDRYDNI